jgi:hypothetical protein
MQIYLKNKLKKYSETFLEEKYSFRNRRDAMNAVFYTSKNHGKKRIQRIVTNYEKAYDSLNGKKLHYILTECTNTCTNTKSFSKICIKYPAGQI